MKMIFLNSLCLDSRWFLDKMAKVVGYLKTYPDGGLQLAKELIKEAKKNKCYEAEILCYNELIEFYLDSNQYNFAYEYFKFTITVIKKEKQLFNSLINKSSNTFTEKNTSLALFGLGYIFNRYYLKHNKHPDVIFSDSFYQDIYDYFNHRKSIFDKINSTQKKNSPYKEIQELFLNTPTNLSKISNLLDKVNTALTDNNSIEIESLNKKHLHSCFTHNEFQLCINRAKALLLINKDFLGTKDTLDYSSYYLLSIYKIYLKNSSFEFKKELEYISTTIIPVIIEYLNFTHEQQILNSFIYMYFNKNLEISIYILILLGYFFPDYKFNNLKKIISLYFFSISTQFERLIMLSKTDDVKNILFHDLAILASNTHTNSYRNIVTNDMDIDKYFRKSESNTLDKTLLDNLLINSIEDELNFNYGMNPLKKIPSSSIKDVQNTLLLNEVIYLCTKILDNLFIIIIFKNEIKTMLKINGAKKLLELENKFYLRKIHKNSLSPISKEKKEIISDLKKIYRLLGFDKSSKFLKHIKHIYFISDFDLPMHLSIANKKYLFEKYNISYSNSLLNFVLMKKNKPSYHNMLITYFEGYEDKKLNTVKKDIEVINNLAKQTALKTKTLNKLHEIKDNLNTDIFHFSGHANGAIGDKWFTLEYSDDILSLSHLLQNNVNSSLYCFFACATSDKLSTKRGFNIGIPSLLTTSGVKNFVGYEWPIIDDIATKQIKIFYNSFLIERKNITQSVTEVLKYFLKRYPDWNPLSYGSLVHYGAN